METIHFQKLVLRMKLFLSLQSFLPYSKYNGVKMFLLVSFSKSKFFTRVALLAFVQHSCRSCSTRVTVVSLVQHSCRSCLALVLQIRLDLNVMQFMCNERNNSICYTTASYEVHTFKKKNERKSLRGFLFIVFPFVSICSQLQFC